MVSLPEGRAAVELARRAIVASLSDPPGGDPGAVAASSALPPLFDEPRGVFVTLKVAATGALRGCVGFPVPVYPLRSGLARVAVAAALEDPRFPPLRAGDLQRVVVEVSVLTVPEAIETEDPTGRKAAVLVGRDGLIVDAGDASGLLLPQVATEQGWDAARFLSETCRKAGLPHDSWKRPGTRIRRFRADVFGEVSPGGPVVAHA